MSAKRPPGCESPVLAASKQQISPSSGVSLLRAALTVPEKVVKVPVIVATDWLAHVAVAIDGSTKGEDDGQCQASQPIKGVPATHQA